MSTATIANARPDNYAGPRCESCGGPCWRWKGSVHGYTCTTCLTAYLDAGAARAAERDQRERAQTLRRLFGNDTPTPVTAEGRRRDGGGLALCTAPRPGVGQ
ncbi:hypothetical protein A5645_05595 [Mycobacterium asiaticum]|uniref:hypothetical protein n=1 Tax=Mycobacterium asiaticum TaxID=1790 RepID=UPI0007EFABA5|nr:hypothetical protein [Mycobacterium asiaticum]OBK97747.1 hypothetical protein A5645_05595 [Mycobacterium asiaticum]